MALPNKTLNHLIKDSLTIINWLCNEKMFEVQSRFMIALFEVIKTCKTDAMDTLFKPLLECGLNIPEDVQRALATFTQTITDYKPRQRKLSI